MMLLFLIHFSLIMAKRTGNIKKNTYNERHETRNTNRQHLTCGHRVSYTVRTAIRPVYSSSEIFLLKAGTVGQPLPLNTVRH